MCRDVAVWAQTMVAGLSPVPFGKAVATVVESLKLSGFDLWSFDADDDFEIWGPDFARVSDGIFVTLRSDDECEVVWRSSSGAEGAAS